MLVVDYLGTVVSCYTTWAAPRQLYPGRKKQRRGPETAGESLIGIRAEPPQQGSRGLVCPWDDLGNLGATLLLGIVKVSLEG